LKRDRDMSKVIEKEWMKTTEATRYLGVSTATMARMIRDGRIKTYQHPLDRRKKLVRRDEVIYLKQEAERMAA
jgi:excisionase family DNA binding protein